MPGCSAIGCNNRSEKGYTMKCFPRNPNLRRIWKERVARADWEPSNNSFLCHVHFEAQQWVFSQKGRIKLKKNAVPSIFTITSTRKSPRKRQKLTVRDHRELYAMVESIDDCSSSITTHERKAMHNQKSGNSIISDDNSREISKPLTGNYSGNGFAINTMVLLNPEIEIETKMEIDSELDEKPIENGALTENQPNDNFKIETNRTNKRKSTHECRKDVENSTESHPPVEENNDKSAEKRLEDTEARKSRFTIRVTGIAEDVNEIVQGLGTPPILNYRASEHSANSRKNLVTSVISIIDDWPRSTTSDQDKEDNKDFVKPKLEPEEASNNDSSNFPEIETTSTPIDNNKQLEEKIEKQKEIIKKLRKQLRTENANAIPGSTMELRKRKTRSFAPGQNWLNDSKDSLINDLSLRLNQINEMNKNLNKKIAEQDQRAKKLEYQIRQRDDRIKELNWKLGKASKFLERAEKNTNTYRRKMINMKSFLARRKLREEKIEASEKSLPTQTLNQENHQIYRTVQDIFDENECDDDSIIIDTREDFLRQFKDAI